MLGGVTRISADLRRGQRHRKIMSCGFSAAALITFATVSARANSPGDLAPQEHRLPRIAEAQLTDDETVGVGDPVTLDDDLTPSFLRDARDSLQPGSVPITDYRAALRESYWSNPRLLSERARLRSTDYKVPLARAEFGPKVDFRVGRGYQRTERLVTSVGAPETRKAWVTTASVILSMPLYTFGRLAADERSAWAEVAYGRAVLASVEADTLFDALDAYNVVLRDRQGVNIARDNLQLLEQELRDNRARLAVREVTVTDVQQVETRLEQAKAQVLAARRAAAASEAAFVRVTGALPGAVLAPLPDLSIPVPTLDAAYVYADKHNPVLLAALARERISRAQRDSAKAALLPRIDLSGSAQTSIGQPFNVHRETDLRGEVVVSGPIFHSGANATRVAEANAANDADWRLIDSARRDIRNEVADAWNDWRIQLASIDRFAQARAAAEAAYEGALLQEKAGLRTTLDVLDLAREILLARNSYNNAVAAAFTANARLVQALGVLKFERLLPEEESYDPEQHLERVKARNDVPIVSQLLRTVDGVTASRSDRQSRDPAAEAGIEPVLMGPPSDE